MELKTTCSDKEQCSNSNYKTGAEQKHGPLKKMEIGSGWRS